MSPTRRWDQVRLRLRGEAHTLTGICNPLLRELVADRNLLIALECKVVYVDDTPGNSSL